MSFKMFLWSIGLLKENICPYCKKEMEEHYIKVDSFGNECWKCKTKDCEFNR
jgi:hypothetical protein